MMGKYTSFKALPMGLTCSPRIFTGLMKVAVRFFRKKGIWIVIYINDILIIALTKEECHRKVEIVKRMLERMGFLINLPKSCLEPTKEFTYLGYQWNTVQWTVRVTKKRLHSIRKLATKNQECRHSSLQKGGKFGWEDKSSQDWIPIGCSQNQNHRMVFLTDNKEKKLR